MEWVVYALITAFALSTADALSKRALASADEMVIVWVREGYALPFIAAFFIFTRMPELDGTFFAAVAAALPLEILAIILYVRAIRLSPLSLTVPFMALSPVFIAVIAFFTLGEVPSARGAIGILLIVAGAYLLNASASKEGLLGPFRAITKERGSVLMIIVAFLYSITSVLGKVAIQHSSPSFFAFFYPLIILACITPMLKYRGKLGEVFSHPKKFIPIGIATAVMIMCHFEALNLTDVAYMISVKRTSLIFSVIYGKLLFYEEKTSERLAGCVVMVLGVALITLS